MSIIASASVPAGSRLIDADTANLTGLRQYLADVQLVKLAARRNPEGVRRLAAVIRTRAALVDGGAR